MASPDAGVGQDGGRGLICSATIGDNHGHTLMVPGEDVEAGMSKTYALIGVADHLHLLALFPDDMAALAAGIPLTLESTFSGSEVFATHAHLVALHCE